MCQGSKLGPGCARKITGHALRICHDVVKFVSNFSRERVSLISEARRL